MNAIHCPTYGGPEVLKVIDIPTPVPGEGEVLIKVMAASINAYDDHIMRGSPFLVRLREGLLRPKNTKILGADIAGTIAAIGKNATDFALGDAVYGCLADSSGDRGFAQYATAKQSVLAKIPKGISMEMAASLPMAAVTALQGLRDVGQIKSGQKVLINGASGGVGSFALQLAKSFGAEVTAVCSTRNQLMARSLGADHVLDYTTTDFSRSSIEYDLILDVAAKHSLSDCRRALKPNGICAVAGYSGLGHVIGIMLFGKRSNRRIKMVMADNTKRSDLLFLNELLEKGQLVPVIDGSYPLCDIQKAFEYFENQHAQGKVIIRVSD